MEKLLALVFAFITVIAVAFGLGLLFAFPVAWLTNYLFAPTFLLFVFGTAQLTFWKAYGLAIFLGWLVKGTPATPK